MAIPAREATDITSAATVSFAQNKPAGRDSDRMKPESFFVHEEVTEGMQEFAIQELNIFSMCKGVEHATLIGTACAAVTEQHG